MPNQGNFFKKRTDRFSRHFIRFKALCLFKKKSIITPRERKFPLPLRGVLAPGSVHAWTPAWPPSDTRGNFSAHMSGVAMPKGRTHFAWTKNNAINSGHYVSSFWVGEKKKKKTLWGGGSNFDHLKSYFWLWFKTPCKILEPLTGHSLIDNRHWKLDIGQYTLVIGQRILDNEQWTLDNWQWTMDIGQWSFFNEQLVIGQRILDNEQWTLDNWQWTLDHGQWKWTMVIL